MSRQRFPKKEKLTHKRLWESVFQHGVRLKAYPLILIFREASLPGAVREQAGFAAPKRHFPKAVDRNRIKRILREAYRLEKSAALNSTKGSYAIVIVYIGKGLPDFQEVRKATKSLLQKIADYEEYAED